MGTLEDLKLRKRPAFLDSRSQRKGGQRRLNVDGLKALPASEAQREKVMDFMA